MLPAKSKKAYSEFYDSARYNEILEPKPLLCYILPQLWLLAAIREWNITLALPGKVA